METLLKNRTVIGAIILFVIAWFMYSSFGGPSQPSTVNTTGISSQGVGADLLKISNDLSEATLNSELFSKPAYQLLSDFSTEIPEQPVGRNNPFDVIGRE